MEIMLLEMINSNRIDDTERRAVRTVNEYFERIAKLTGK